MSGEKITSLKLHFPLLSGYPAKWEDKEINAFPSSLTDVPTINFSSYTRHLTHPVSRG